MTHALRRPPAPTTYGTGVPLPAPPAPPASPTDPHVPVRSTTMHMLYEELARAHHQRLLDEAARARPAARHVHALRAVRAARRAASRAERARLREGRMLALSTQQ